MLRSAALASVLASLLWSAAGCDGAHGSARPSGGVVHAAEPVAPEPPPLPVPREERLGRDVRVEVLADGAGAPLLRGGRARVHCTSRAAGSEEPFATTRPGVPLAVVLGTTPLVPGLARALEGRRAGAKLVVHVPAAMGYADAEHAPVPPGTDLAFDVEVVSVR